MSTHISFGGEEIVLTSALSADSLILTIESSTLSDTARFCTDGLQVWVASPVDDVATPLDPAKDAEGHSRLSQIKIVAGGRILRSMTNDVAIDLEEYIRTKLAMRELGPEEVYDV